MSKKLIVKIEEALSSVLPITIIVLFLNFTISPMPFGVRGLFLIGSIMLIIGMGLFTLGADLAMMPMGEQMGANLTRSRKLGLLVFVSLLMGILITIAEPDLQVLATQVPSVPNNVLVFTVAIGVGLFLVLAVLRILFQLKLSYLLIIFYVIVFIMGRFVPEEYLAVAFDSGGVTTGPITVPFILALGVGISAVRGGKSSHDDSFGLVALCSIGPIMAVMVLGMFYDSSSAGATTTTITDVENVRELFLLFKEGFPHYFREVGLALSPIVVLFIIFQIATLRLPVSQMIKMGIGILYTFGGLVLFLTGVNVGFLPAGSFIGAYIGDLSYSWILIPLGMVIGYFTVAAEPAVHVLNTQVEDMSGGAISKQAMLLSLSIGVAISVGLAMVRVLYGISIWYILIPGYGIALILTFFVPKIFTAIAFDSGGVASGPMTATFLLPFAMGACESSGGNMMTDAFGIVAMVAMTPLVTIQIMGLIYKIKVSSTEEDELETFEEIADIMEEEEYVDWASPIQASEVYENPDWLGLEDNEFVASPEWLEEVHDDQVYEAITADNEYIDFDALEALVKPEDFEVPARIRAKIAEEEWKNG